MANNNTNDMCNNNNTNDTNNGELSSGVMVCVIPNNFFYKK